MKKHYCDQTGQEIKGAVYKLQIMPPENGYVLTTDESRMLQAFYEKDFSSPEALADYIKQHPEK